jgi:hypothetical protein
MCEANQQTGNLDQERAMTPNVLGPREAILQRLEAEESHCISRLNRLREAKLEVVMASNRECSLFDKIHGVFGDKW